MIKVIRNYSIWLSLTFLLTSCSTAQEKTNEKQVIADIPESYYYTDILLKQNQQQQSAFDALNTLQTSTDEMNRLYSTFANIYQPCYPADTSFTISRSVLLTAMEQFVTKHCTNLSFDERDKLAATAVLAQEEYIVLYCPDKPSNVNYEKGLPLTGTWVMPSVLGRRDVILVW